MSRIPELTIAAVLSAASCVFAQNTVQQPAPASNGTEQGLAELKINRPEQALAGFQSVLQSDPNNIAANLYAASAALALYKGDLAVQYAEKARQLDPNNWKIHTTLVAAYAVAGRKQQRDEERALLRKLHSDPSAPDAIQTSGFLLEMFPVKQYRVEAVEYFQPIGKFHIYYRFILRNAQGKRIWQIDAESNDFDQASWAKAHPDLAAAGQRQFQVVADSGDVHYDYRLFSGTPDYDTIRAQVVQVIQSRTTPFPGES